MIIELSCDCMIKWGCEYIIVVIRVTIADYIFLSGRKGKGKGKGRGKGKGKGKGKEVTWTS